MDKVQIKFLKIRDALLYQRNFDCETFLGRGVFGEIVKAKCRKDGETYAIKILPYKYEDVTMKYQQPELELLTRLGLSEDSKRNVINYFKSWILQVGDTQRLCIQMEWCFRDLQTFVYDNEMGGPKIIRTQGQGQPHFYQLVFPQILNGLVAIHSIGWIHRDIHPSNILIANPNPKQICDIVVKIADFGLAKHIGSNEIEFQLDRTWTIVTKHEKLALSKNSLFRAPELSTETYDFKVDVYSAGMVLYFISRYLEDESKLKSELEALRKGELDINACLCDKDDEKLCNLIKNLVQEDPKKRPNACVVMEYMYSPTQAKDATDSSRVWTGEFLARKDSENDMIECYLKEFTLSDVKEAVKSGTGVEIDGQVLRQERMINGEKKFIKINCDCDVYNIFHSAAKDKHDVEVVVHEKPHNMEIDEKYPSECNAEVYMYPPTQAKDATDSGATEFFARKDGETAFSHRHLKELTLAAMREEVESHTGVEADRQVLQQERMLNGEKRRVKLDSDRQVQIVFQSAANDNRDVEVVVSEFSHSQSRYAL